MISKITIGNEIKLSIENVSGLSLNDNDKIDALLTILKIKFKELLRENNNKKIL